MAKKDPIGASVSLDISQLKKAIDEANRLIRENETQWRVNASTMADWTKEEKGLTDRIKVLDKAIETYTKNIADITAEKEDLIQKGYKPESAEMAKVNKMLNSQLKALENSRKEHNKLTAAVEKMTEENKDSNEEIQDTTQESKKASKALDKLEDSAKDAGDGFTIAKGAIAGFIANGLTAMISAVGSAVGSLLSLTESTLEYRREMARITTVADQVGVSGDRIIDKWIDMNAVIQDESSVTEGLNNLMTAGFTAEKELDAITKALEGASIQWAETLKFEGLSDSLQEWIGSGGASLTGQFAELLERLGYDLEDVEKATEGMTDAQRRNWAIMTLNKAGLDEVSEGYRNANKDMIAYNKANSDLLHAQSMLGEQMQPFVTTMKQGAADILYSFLDMVNGVEGAGDQLIYNVGYLAGEIYSSVRGLISSMAPTLASFFPEVITLVTDNLPQMVAQGVAIMTSIIDGIAENVPLAVAEISTMLTDILMMIAENAPLLLSSAVDLFGQILLGLSQMVVNLASELPKVITTITDGLLNGEQSVLDTAIDVLMEIVNAIPTIVDDLLRTMPDIIDAVLTSLSNALPKVFDAAIDLLSEIVNAIPDIVASLVKNLPQIIDAIIKGLSDALPKVASGAVELFTEIINAIPSIASELLGAMPQIITAIVKGLANGASELFQAGLDIVGGIIDGILSFDVWGAVKSVGKSILNGFKSVLGIASPSKEMRDEVGINIGKGIVEGIEETTSEIIDAGEELSGSFSEGFIDGMNHSKDDITETVEDTVEEAVKAASSSEGVKEVGKAMAENVLGGPTDFSGYVDIGNNVLTAMREGDPTDVADQISTAMGQLGGVWGALADSIWTFISDNLLNMSASEVKETAEDMVENLIDTLLMIMNNAPDIVAGGIEFIVTFAEGMIKGIPQMIRQLPEIISEMVSTLISDGIPALFEVGAQLIQGLIEGMFSINIWDVIKSIGKGIVDGFKKLFGIKSPSKVMADEIGKNLALGIEEGLTDNLAGVNAAIRNGVDTSLETDGIQRKQVNVYQTNNYAQAHSRYELYKSKHDTAAAVKLALQGA